MNLSNSSVRGDFDDFGQLVQQLVSGQEEEGPETGRSWACSIAPPVNTEGGRQM